MTLILGRIDKRFWFFPLIDCTVVKIFFPVRNKFDTAWKVSKYGVISGSYFPVFGLNMERYSVSLRIQPEYGKIRTRNNSVFGHFSSSVQIANTEWIAVFSPNKKVITRKIWIQKAVTRSEAVTKKGSCNFVAYYWVLYTLMCDSLRNNWIQFK